MDEYIEKNEFELAVEKYDMPKKSGAHVFNIENEFADVKDPLKYTSLSVRVIPIKNEILGLFKNVDDLYIGSYYKGDLSFVNDINPKKIIIQRSISWNELRDLNLLSVEELRICVESSVNPIVIKAPGLRKLFLSGNYKGSIIFLVGLAMPHYRLLIPSASLDMNLRQCFRVITPTATNSGTACFLTPRRAQAS